MGKPERTRHSEANGGGGSGVGQQEVPATSDNDNGGLSTVDVGLLRLGGIDTSKCRTRRDETLV